MCDLVVLRAPKQARSPEANHRFFTLLEREISALVHAGFPVRDAVDAYMTLSVYTRGCVLNERLFTAAEEQMDRSGYRDAPARRGSGRPPGHGRGGQVLDAKLSTEEKFEAGIGLIIDGLRVRLALVAGH